MTATVVLDHAVVVELHARQATPKTTALLFRLTGHTAHRTVVGQAEGSPLRRTPNRSDRIWSRAGEALSTLTGQPIRVDSTATARQDAARIVAQLATTVTNGRRRASGILDGIEAALLDLAGNATSATSTAPGLAHHIDDARRYRQWPSQDPPTLLGRPANSYPDDEACTRRMTKAAFRSHLVEREALGHGLATTRFTHETFIAHADSSARLPFGAAAHAPLSAATSFVIADHHKGAAYALLARAGAPVPAGQMFAPTDIDGATAYAGSIGYPVVTKPAGGTGGVAVTLDITSDEQVAAGFDAVAASRFADSDVLVQRYLPGGVYRIVVLDGEVIAAVLRELPSVTGDGRRSIAELIIEKNSYRRANPHLRKVPIGGSQAAEFLRGTGIDLDDVPRRGERIVLADQPFLERGAESVDVLEELHPSIADAMTGAVHAIPGLRFCGIDAVLTDHRRPLDGQTAGICELNAGPDLANPPFPGYGQPRNIARGVLRACADAHGVELAGPAEELALRIAVHGDLAGTGYPAWLADRARRLGLRGSIRQARTVEALACGPASAAAALASTAITGTRGARPEFVTTSHTEPVDVAEFTDLSEPTT